MEVVGVAGVILLAEPVAQVEEGLVDRLSICLAKQELLMVVVAGGRQGKDSQDRDIRELLSYLIHS